MTQLPGLKRRVVVFAATSAVAMAGWSLAQTPPPGSPPPAGQPTPTPPGQPAPGAQPLPSDPAGFAAPATLPGPTTQPAANAVVATVGNETITYGDFERFIDGLTPNDQEMARGPFKREWAESYVNMKLLAQEAARRKLDESPQVKQQLALLREQVLANAMVTQAQQSVDDAALKKYFDENKQTLERVSARHILVRTPKSAVPLRPGQKELTEEQAKAKADQLVQQLKGGADFAKLAREQSDDEGSGAEGGDLGSFTRDKMVPAFSQAAFALKPNEISQPVRSEFGWHVIQVTGRYDTFESLADTLRQQLAPNRAQQLVAELKQKTPVKFNDAVVGPAGAPEAPPAPPPGQ